MATPKNELTPMMQQYRRIKETCGDAILMFRLGDFYEMFEDDARITSEILDLTLTKKPVGGGKTVPLAGIPYHALNNYLFKLTRAGHRVAICEQTEDPKKTTTLVKREIVRTVTPGTLVEAEGMEGAENNYLAAIHDGGLEGVGFAVADISTGEFRATAMMTGKGASFQDCTELVSELGKLSPSEILVPEHLTKEEPFLAPLIRRDGCVVSRLPVEVFRDPEDGGGGEEEERKVDNSDLSQKEKRLARKAAGALLRYVTDTYRGSENPLLSLVRYRPAQYLGWTPRRRETWNWSRTFATAGGGEPCFPCWIKPRPRWGLVNSNSGSCDPFST